METPTKRIASLAQENANVARQGSLGFSENASLALSDAEMARRSEKARERAKALNLSTRKLEKLSGRGRNQVSDVLEGIPAKQEYLFDVEKAIKIAAKQVHRMTTDIILEDDVQERTA